MNGAGQPATAWLVGAVLALAVAALYAQTASFEFVAIDDDAVVLDRPEINAGITLKGVRSAFTEVLPDWQPLTSLSHMMVFTFAGRDARTHHLVNAALHVANTVLLFVALRLLTGEIWPSAFAAALFGLHPLRAESVAWVVERKDTLSGLFWMLTLIAYASYARRSGVARYMLVALAVGCGLMSKGMLVSLPPVLLLLDVWPLARWRGGKSGADGGASAAALLVEKLPLFLLALGGAAVTVVTATQSQSLKSAAAFPLAWRVVLPPLAYATYILQTLWPSDLAVMYPHPATLGDPVGPWTWRALVATPVLVAITAASIATWRSRPYLIVGWLWFLLTLLPVIGVVQAGIQWHADRFTYIPSIGLAIMLAWSLRDLAAWRPRLRRPLLAASTLALAALFVASWRQIAVWRNSRALLEHAAAVTRDNFFAYQTLGAVLVDAGDLDAAEQHLGTAIRIRPEESYAREHLGLLYERRGQADLAAASYEEALRLDPGSSWLSRRQLVLLRIGQGRLDDAVALMAAPDAASAEDSGIRLALGEALAQRGRTDEALAQMQRAVALAPSSAKARNNLGVLLYQAGLYAEAAKEFERALELDPNFRAAAENLERTRQRKGAS